MTTTSISGSEFGKADNGIYWEDVTDGVMDAIQNNYWIMLTRSFNAICKEKGSTAWIELDLSAVYYEVSDKTEIDFYEVLAEARREAYEYIITYA